MLCINVSFREQARTRAFLEDISPGSATHENRRSELELELATTLKQELTEVHLGARRNLCEFLLPYEADLERRSITPRGLGEMLHHSIVGLKLSTTTRAEIESVVATMHACLMALTAPVQPA